MSRVLAQIMGASEPAFKAQIMRLEKAAGLPGADIRLMVEIVGETKAKIRALGLDPQDTTGPELYEVLRTRLLQDEVRVRASLNMRADGTPASVLEAVKDYLTKSKLPTQTFVVKQSAMRAIMKKLRPKATTKFLGYRSMDSMIKHEPIALLLAASSLVESSEWQERRIEAYKKLTASDFETRKMSYFMPTSKRWPQIAADFIRDNKHHLLSVPELGAMIILPVEEGIPGLATTTLVLIVDAINEMRSLSSYLKLQQVKPNFGGTFVEVLKREPMTAADLAGESVSWKTLQWFYGKGHSAYYPEAFEPHVQPEDLSWHNAESLLVDIHPALEFWEGSELLALLDEKGQAVSMNILDVALNTCNGLSYGDRVIGYMRMSLGRELLARYLHHDNLQALLLGKLDEQLMPELVAD